MAVSSDDKLITLSLLQQFGEEEVVSIRKLASLLSLAVSGLNNEVDAISAATAPTETSPASSPHAVGSFIIYGGKTYMVLEAIEKGDTLTAGTNITAAAVGGRIKAIEEGIAAKGLSVVNGRLCITYEK